MQGKLRIAVAGAGSFGREHIRVLAGMDDVALVGIADPDTEAAGKAAATYGVPLHTADVRYLLDRTRPDGLVIASPGRTHVPVALIALERGIPMLLEKPVGMSAADADTLIAAEAKSSAFILPGHILRFARPYRDAVEIVRSGEIGAALSVSARNHRDESHAVRYPDIDPVLMTLIHDIDLAVWVTGAPLTTVLALRRPEGTLRSETIIAGSDSSGRMWSMTNAWTYPTTRTPPDRFEVIGDNGSVELELGEHIRVCGKNPRLVDLKAAPPDNELLTELSYFAECIRSGRRPSVVTLQDARAGLVSAEAILESLRTGDIVRR